MCYLNKRNPHPVISAPTPYTLGASGTAVWIVISGKFTAQTALGYEDRLSPQLLMLLSYSSTGENQFHGFLFFFFHLTTVFCHSSKGRAELPFTTVSPGKDVWKLGLLLPIHVSEILPSTRPSFSTLYSSCNPHLSSSLPFELGLLISCLLLFLFLLLSTHTPMELLLYYTVSWALHSSGE